MSGFSLAMVVRSALALSANGGKVAALVSPSLEGATALAGIRHLVNGGAHADVILLPTADAEIDGLTHSLHNRGVTITPWHSLNQWPTIKSTLLYAHNCIVGVKSENAEYSPFLNTFISEMNEEPLPVHAIGKPLGIDADLGRTETAIYASSTLSLGLPLKGLSLSEEYVGRHYLADISWSRETYAEMDLDGPPLFAEQPVIRLSVVV